MSLVSMDPDTSVAALVAVSLGIAVVWLGSRIHPSTSTAELVACSMNSVGGCSNTPPTSVAEQPALSANPNGYRCEVM